MTLFELLAVGVIVVLVWAALIARIAADAEIIKAERARADKYEAESEQKGADSSWLYASMEEKNHNLKLLYDKSNRQEAELATLREQVRTLREALVEAIDREWNPFEPDNQSALWRRLKAALAATEPKG